LPKPPPPPRLKPRCYLGGGFFDGATADGWNTGNRGPDQFFSNSKSDSWFLIAETGCTFDQAFSMGSGRIAVGIHHHTVDLPTFTGSDTHSPTGYYTILERQLWRKGTDDDLKENGRGFAVVADEVRKLADRTTKATEEISQSISTIRQQTSRTVEQMNQGTTCVREGVQRAETARNRLQQIVAGTTQVSHMIADIVPAADQQRATTKSVVGGVSEITANSRAVRDGANESAQAATLLAEHATRMRDLVNRFKVPAAESTTGLRTLQAADGSASRPPVTGKAR
jgi:hypothetical protein